MRVKDAYIRWHVLRMFFQDLAQWSQVRSCVDLAGEVSREDYERLLMGADAEVYVPLWASACLTGEDILLNATTLEVIRFYKRFGYRWVEMDGNPPDYLGQQCRFLEYLCACRLQREDRELEEAAEDFCDRFLAPCAHSALSAARSCGLGEGVLAVLQALEDTACGRELPVRDDRAAAGFDSVGWSRGEEIPVEPPRTVSHVSFCDCGNKCRMLSTVQEGCVLSILPDKNFMGKSFSGCPRGMAYRHTFLTSRRLRYPMVRTGERGEGKFRRISWEEAEKMVAGAIRRTGEQYGPASRHVLPAAGVCGLLRGDLLMSHLLSCAGGYLDFYNYYSAPCAEHALPYVYGTSLCGSAEEQLLESRLLLLWGHNPVETHWGDGHTETFVQAKRRGTRVVVIDPRCSDTALLFADQWIPIRPSTDGALADAMAYVIWSQGLQDQEFMDRFCLGFDEAHMPAGVPAGESLYSYLFGAKDGVAKTPQWAEKITGVPAETIEALAVEYASTKPACLLPGLGPQRTLNGEQTCRSMAMLACLTGNVGVAGGSAGAVTYLKGQFHGGPRFQPAEDPYPGKIPGFLWTRAVDAPETLRREDGLVGVEQLDTGVKLLFSLASGLLVNQHSNINDTLRILRRDALETLVVSDLFMTPGSRFADLLLPGVSFFETENIMTPWSSADYLLYDQQAIPPLFGGRLEYDWIAGVARRLGLEEAFSGGRAGALDWLAGQYETHRREREPELPEFSVFRRQGGYVYQKRTYRPAFQENIQDGIPFATPSGKIEIFSKRLYEGGVLPGIPCYTPCEEGWEDAGRSRYPLQLIGYHSKRRCHSIGDPNRQLESLELPGVWIHPKDAERRGILDGQLVEIFNDRGVVCIPARVTERIVPGAVAMSEGAWYTPDRKGRDRRGSINVLTMTHRSTPLAHGNPQHTNLVEIRPAPVPDEG